VNRNVAKLLLSRVDPTKLEVTVCEIKSGTEVGGMIWIPSEPPFVEFGSLLEF
jgi:hypothetical protein